MKTKTALNGVAASLSHFDAGNREQKLTISENGFIGFLKAGKVVMTIIADEGLNSDLKNVIPYQTRKPTDRNTWAVKLLDDKAREGQVERVYHVTIPINKMNQTVQEQWKPEAYPGNNFKVAVIKDDGMVQIWNFGIIAQNNKFFFICEMRCETQAYRIGNEVFCEEFREHRWVALKERLQTNFEMRGNLENIPMLDKHPERSGPKKFNAVLQNKQAQCTGYSVLQGLGWARTVVKGREEIVTFHWKTCPYQNGIKQMMPGQVFEYATMSDPPADSRTEFRHQIYHLKLAAAVTSS